MIIVYLFMNWFADNMDSVSCQTAKLSHSKLAYAQTILIKATQGDMRLCTDCSYRVISFMTIQISRYDSLLVGGKKFWSLFLYKDIILQQDCEASQYTNTIGEVAL